VKIHNINIEVYIKALEARFNMGNTKNRTASQEQLIIKLNDVIWELEYEMGLHE
tara:strand:- start:7220 stop:7381 length:162 start_codon:yes stop_codon:yes gene_type:complete